jgi:hypothetical protein
MPRQQHPGLSQVGQQQSAQVVQVQGVQAHPQQIPQQPTRVQQPQLTPPAQYGGYPAGGQIQIVSYTQPNQMGQIAAAPQQFRLYNPGGQPTAYYQTPSVAYNHLQQWQIAQSTQQQLHNQAAHQQYYQMQQVRMNSLMTLQNFEIKDFGSGLIYISDFSTKEFHIFSP